MAHTHVARSREELRALLGAPEPPEALVPDLVAAVAAPETLRERPGLDLALAESADALADIANMPSLTYSLFRSVQRQIDRSLWEVPFFEKRSKLAAAALQVLLGNDRYRNDLYDYIWSVCEETIWIVPQCFGGGEGSKREPTAREQRVMTYLALLHGARGIQYFIRKPPSSFPKSPEMWAECSTLALEAAELTPEEAAEAAETYKLVNPRKTSRKEVD